jgi:hypothetical protein
MKRESELKLMADAILLKDKLRKANGKLAAAAKKKKIVSRQKRIAAKGK